MVTSFLLLKYPTLLHQRKKQRFLSKHISHRGGERGPQNPMAEVGGGFFFRLELRVLRKRQARGDT